MEEFWNNLVQGKESITFFDDGELELAGIDPALLQKKNYVKAGAVLDNIDQFDASFFGFTPREAEILDPQHRLFLESGWEALELAGYAPEKYEGRIGVYAGVFTSSYLFNLYTTPGLVESVGELSVRHGNEKDYLATRMSYKFNLKGPSVSVQTSCSTSLVAVHLAVQNLLGGECDMALAGGVSISAQQKTGYLYQEGDVLTPDGHCRPFDAKAGGTIFGNGVGVVVLKRLDDAIEEGDTIYAVIKGSAINNDGSDKVSFIAPSVNGQAEVIADALAMADVKPSTIGMIEAHGTGTILGDPIEIAALTKVYRAETDQKNYCAVGSVKSNVGHLGAASGVAGLIKAALSLKHKIIPPSLHFETPNPSIDFANSPFFVNTETREWKEPGEIPRRAGVSSFGMGGTNAHVVLEECVEYREQPSIHPKTEQLLVLSALTDQALDQAAERLQGYLESQPDAPLADIAFTLQAGRREFPHRTMLVARTSQEALEKLNNQENRKLWKGQAATGRRIAFVFPGQGSQYVGMAQELYEKEQIFRETLDSCSAALQPLLGLDLRTLLFHPSKSEAASEQLQQTAMAQPSLFAIEYSLAKQLEAWGIEPSYMLGHSIGEYAAACLAGVFSLEDALRIVAARGRLMQRMPAGGMLSVPLTEAQAKERLIGSLSIAAVNAPELTIVAGPVHEIEEVRGQLAAEGISTQLLHTSHAFHSAMMDPILDEFFEELSRIDMKAPTIPYLSNLTGKWIQPEEAVDPQYWTRHLRETVRFSDGVQILLDNPDILIVEVGPGHTLSGLIKKHGQSDREPIAVPLIRHPKDRQSDRLVLLQGVGRLWLEGASVNWSGLHGGSKPGRIPLVTYPFQRESYWIERKSASLASTQASVVPDSGHVYAPVWKRTAALAPTSELQHDAVWLLTGDVYSDVSRLLSDSLRQRGVRVLLAEEAKPAEALRQASEIPARIVVIADGSTGAAELEELAAELGRRTEANLASVSVVSVGALNIAGRDYLWPQGGVLLAVAKDIEEQNPAFGFTRLDIFLENPHAAWAGRAALHWADELLSGQREEADVAYRGVHRYVFSLEALPAASGSDRNDASGKEGTLLFAGAPDEFRLKAAEALIGQGYKNFAFLAPADSLNEGAILQDGVQRAEAELIQQLRDQGIQLHIYEGKSALAGDILSRLGEEGQRFTAINGLLIGPGSAAEAEAELRALAPWLEEHTPEFVLCISERIAELEAQENQAVRAVSPRQAEAALASLAEQLERQLGITVLITRLVNKEWTVQQQGKAVSDVVTGFLARTVLAARESYAADSPFVYPIADQEASLDRLEAAATRTPANGESRGIKEEVTAIWEDLFGIQPIAPDDDFFGLGGNSMLAIQLMTRVRNQYDIELQLENMFDDPTVNGLSKQIAEALGQGEEDEMESLLKELEGQSWEDIEKELEKLNS
ncbi:type I polyketide synthase [Paenibacillus roseus]|uniref:type I polyketide synthase n=1 Tax=Paenibacillus roseus TaxID=2798579 RepID=UPI003F69570A